MHTHAHTEIVKCKKLMSLRLRVPEQSLKHSRHKGPLPPAAHARRYFAYLDFFVWDYFLVLNNLQNVRKCKAENREITGSPYLVMDLSFAVSAYQGLRGRGVVWIKTSFQGFVYYGSLKDSPFDQEPKDSMLCPLKNVLPPQDPSADFVSFENPVYFGNSAVAPEVPLMSIESNILHCIMEKLFPLLVLSASF